jgi:hypothetical protein
MLHNFINTVDILNRGEHGKVYEQKIFDAALPLQLITE